ncbi:MAG TPA: hypothetical protein VFW25_02285 [Silvibacterium sp.]|nr:hypothetical protein [Silvibacterium sp.]
MIRAADIALLAVLTIVSGLLAAPFMRSWIGHRRLLFYVLLGGILLSQLLFRRFYWQVAPADAACLLLALGCLLIGRIGAIHLSVISAVAFVLTGMSLVCLIVLPLFRLPRPTGPYLVGTRNVRLIDPHQSDSSFPSGRRELMVQVWYPTDSRLEPLGPYRRWADTTVISSYDAFLKTHSHLNAPVSLRGGAHPVLLFNPAWGGLRTQNTYQTEELASYGYIVIAIDHTHNSARVAFPDGELVKASAVQSIDDFTNSTFDKQMAIANQELDTQAKDDSFVLDAFSAANDTPDSPWFRTMDMRRVGVFGHSFGGAASVEACFRDSRIRAALNMDGWMYGRIARKPLQKPLFLMYEQGWPPDEKQLSIQTGSDSPTDRMNVWDYHNLQRTLSEYGGYVLTLFGTKHMNFSDRSLYSPIRRMTDSGGIDPNLAHRIINRYTLAFFSHALNGTYEPILDQTSPVPYPQVHFSEWRVRFLAN